MYQNATHTYMQGKLLKCFQPIFQNKIATIYIIFIFSYLSRMNVHSSQGKMWYLFSVYAYDLVRYWNLQIYFIIWVPL